VRCVIAWLDPHARSEDLPRASQHALSGDPGPVNTTRVAARRTPFDYGVIRNAKHAEKRFLYLGVKRAYAKRKGWKIIPKHPLADGEPYELLDWNEGIEAIDWHQLDKKGTWDTDHECKQACMAEALASSHPKSRNRASRKAKFSTEIRK
jgi:hypothetical protein